jgi:probable rRNA maturation factor
MEVLISNRQKTVRLNLRRIRRIAEEIMRFEGSPDNAELSVVFCDDDFIQKLNHDHLGHNEPTDVLSFPMDEQDFETEVRLVGDLVISVETAVRQAAKLRHPPTLEVVFLMIHGLLHLHGYDHLTKSDRARMRRREETIYSLLGEKQLLKGLAVEIPQPLIRRHYGRREPGSEPQ